MLNSPSPGNATQPVHLLSVLTGLAFGVAVCLTLIAIIFNVEHVDAEVFGGRILIAALTSIIVFSSHRLLNSLQDSRVVSLFPKLTWRWFIVFMVVLLTAYVEKTSEQLSRKVMLLWLLLTPFSLMLTALLIRTTAGLYYSNPARRRKAILIWSNSACAELVNSLRNTPLAAVDVIGFFDNRNTSRPPSNLPRLGDLEDAAEWMIDPESGKIKVDVVFIGMNTRDPEELGEILEILYDSTVTTYFVPESLIFGMPGIQLRELAGRPVLASIETPFIGLAGLPKRVLDFIGATIGLILLAPVLLAVAIGVRMSSPGPIFFRQVRYGIAGKPINVYKFRSMKIEPEDVPVIQATVGDTRVTKFGSFIRKTSLDELPQLFNVLSGDMSLVGPRPHAVAHNELYRKLVNGYMFRHKIKPGITGWAQVNGLRGETETLEKMQARVDYDLYYLQHWSIWLDIVIIWRTVKVVFGDKNAY
ncbi:MULTISPECIES: undecaprenyl-phosphate glucose phosphotransferase [unclassified Undibacterium]|uniref:undecaprenyl-phosphate glucose phosphotransferase n=2 Tax=Oxalobacteraceae TaxID=75682 RepID=UPI002AC9C975|nr:MULTISPECIES: undecaprenyl-phosphate glucose phosphotransferase [unclassified Undibacterium]MEB0138475.1 undecaprenyl-phosphate glucose phosphotransferase [Undibacterium sp. CCC2.1]MEB0173125.1 undecaprenyl-phosphate glucose phosphotransferase [Undibacterium sp. CCC1.1]MEB0177515.1 undecaprenyl-phosphate glucose phosphotransferase [Undibacterium sp. CCC3.4]MEB0216169.1 undecaprenyl-phosphate glucose phosphotransferase [Undibacterium sp. 5I2]WPX42782.1 undecaprenyl-phosphate glucose phosphot